MNDLILYNAQIYTVNAQFDIAQAMVVQGGRVVAVGSNVDILNTHLATETRDMGGKPIYPGFFDAHCHFIRYALSLYEVDLRGCRSAKEMVQRVVTYRQANADATHIIGRGWNQDDWQTGDMPDNALLNELLPDIPVLLMRIDLHAALANDKALALAQFDINTQIAGGKLHIANGQLTGLLIDNAIYCIVAQLPSPNKDVLIEAILAAQQNCLAVGLTTLSDALSIGSDIALFDELQRNGKLQLRLYCMIDGASGADKRYFLQRGILRNDRLHVRCIKYFADGAIGSRGAWLLEPYSDDPTQYGIALYSPDAFLGELRECYQAGFQVATHAIGDAANQFVLNSYAEILQGNNPYRWRLEHAQVVQPSDTGLIGQHHIIPSIQATHATSDMTWVATRLGERLFHAYRWQDLWQQNGMVAAGSDFPVEDINPLLGFYAAIARRDLQGNPPAGFMPDQALSRRQALEAMTIYAAYANAEDDEKGSLEAGKLADFVVLDRDIMSLPLGDVPAAQVIQTWIGGQAVFVLDL